MDAGTLFVSFWDLCLDNVPAGTVRRQDISANSACSLIAIARSEYRLRCVSRDDLVAPYRSRERHHHDQLRRVLHEAYGIDLSLEDFLVAAAEEPSVSYTFPLQGAPVRDRDCLLVVTASFVVPELRNGELLPAEIEPSSVAFALIAAVEDDILRSPQR